VCVCVCVCVGEFEESTKPDEGTWTREGDVLVITVAKHGDMSWWVRVCLTKFVVREREGGRDGLCSCICVLEREEKRERMDGDGLVHDEEDICMSYKE